MADKKSRRASERRNAAQEHEEQTRASRGREVDGAKTVEGAIVSEAAPDALTRETQRVASRQERSTSSRFTVGGGEATLDPDQEFRRAVLDAEEDLPDTAIDDSTKEERVYLNGEIEVVSGSDAEATFALDAYPAILGRDLEAGGFNLTDSAISKQHLIFNYLKETGRWEMSVHSDASNGAKLNDEMVNEAKSLHHGDVIQVGRSRLRFYYRPGTPVAAASEDTLVDKDPVTRKTSKIFTSKIFDFKNEGTEALRAENLSDGAAPRHATGKRLLAILASLTVLCLGGWFAFQSFQDPAGPADVAQIESLLKLAQADLREQRIEAAELKIKSIEPFAAQVPSIKSFLRMLSAEKDALAHTLKARELAKAGDLEALKTELAMIPDSSAYAADRNQIRADVLEKARVASVKKIERLLNNRSFKEAEKAISDHKAMWNDDREWDLDAYKKRRAPDTARTKKARDLMGQGALGQALALFEASASKPQEQGFHNNLMRLQRLVGEGKSALKKKSGSKALQAFTEALRVYKREAANRDGTFFRALKQDLANAHYLLGATVIGRDRCRGATHFLSAYDLAPDDPKIKSRLGQMRQQADETLRKAQAQKNVDPNGAKKIAREAMCLVKKGSPLHRQLARLAKR